MPGFTSPEAGIATTVNATGATAITSGNAQIIGVGLTAGPWAGLGFHAGAEASRVRPDGFFLQALHPGNAAGHEVLLERSVAADR